MATSHSRSEAQSRGFSSSPSLVRSRVAYIIFHVTLFLLALKPLVHMAERTIYPWYTKRFVADGNLSKSDVLIGFLGPMGHIGYFGSGILLSLPTVLRFTKGKMQLRKGYQSIFAGMPVILLAWIVGNTYAYVVLMYFTKDDFVFGELPRYQHVARDILVFMLVEEVMLYYLHRLFHEWKAGYRAVHKLHHRFTATVPLQALHSHPIDQIVTNVTPILAGTIIMQSHILTFTLWLTFAFINTLVSHSGYDHIFVLNPEMHDLHHERGNCNYGVLGILDYLHGTYRVRESGAETGDAK
ncbi:hypothetical protein FOZ61_005418 [Perkinsus olseni]|uniref:Fatty acid hydroxylase domain-containing protein n=1 Tax=Perkinsus olseni TaxID=32597 RepID=A0A7J6MI96_PEROL|nr:hypothetical protein FOZ61_005418 [Perkinsus olseni]